MFTNFSLARCPFVQRLSLAAILAAAISGRADPFIPTNDQQVLERLRVTVGTQADRETRALRTRLAKDPENADLAVALAQRCVERNRAEADPRYLGYAQSALAPWWSAARPPIPVLVLRATIRQSQHEFSTALVDLDLAVSLDPSNAQAWLTRATVLTVLGRYDEARRACVPLAQLAPGLIAITAAATVRGLTGGAERSCELLKNVIDGHPAASLSEKLWATTLLGETSARLGRAADAEAFFRRALELSPHDAYLLGAFSDFLLDQKQEKVVESLLENEVRADGLLLRLCLAESALQPVPRSFASHLGTVRARFEASRLRGDSVHQREESRFTLDLLHEPREALRLAQANWQVQREPADARVLLEAAVATGDINAASPVREFMRTNHLEDVQLSKLSARLDLASRK